jgi:Tol biopolymer transport system component
MGSDDLWHATRSDTASAFGPATNLPNINSSQAEGGAALSPDGLTLYFSSNRAGGVGQDDIWVATRPDRASPFGMPLDLAAVNSPVREYGPAISPDGLTLFVKSNRAGGLGGLDVWMATRPDAGSAFGTPINFALINSAADDGRASITADGLSVFFGTNLSATTRGDLWRVDRATTTAAFSAPARLDDVDSSDSDYDPWISPSGDRLYFTSSRPGTGNDDLWVSTRCPP